MSGLLVGVDGLPLQKKEKPVWMPYAEAIYEREYYDALELEWWETAGKGYTKDFEGSENAKWLKRIRSGEITKSNITENMNPASKRRDNG